jgi:acyl carrier protein
MTEKKIKNLIKQYFGVDKVNNDDILSNYGIDSLDYMDFVFRLRKAFPEKDFEMSRKMDDLTVQNLIDLIDFTK